MLRQEKALTILLLLVLTASTLTTIEFIGPAKANPLSIPENVPMEHAYIKSNGDIDPPNLPIQRSGNYYTLKDNLVNYTIDIQTSNVVFDGNGFLITIPPYAELDEHSNPIYKIGDPTINISNKSNIIIKNTRFDNCFFCIEVTNSSNITVTQNSMVNGNMGVYMTSSTYCNIIGNEITDTGLRIIDSTFLEIAYNKISRNLNGAWLTINNSNINRNEISDNYEVGLYLKAPNSNNRIFENNFLNNNIGLLYRGNLNTNVNNTLFNNYWSGNQAAIKNVDYGGVPYAENDADQSPLATPIPFDSSQFPLPSPTLTASPTSTSNPPANPPTPTTTTSPSPSPTPTIEPTLEPAQTATPTNGDNQTVDLTPILALTGIVVVAVGVGALVYFKRRKP